MPVPGFTPNMQWTLSGVCS